jgi:hypothetical protein
LKSLAETKHLGASMSVFQTTPAERVEAGSLIEERIPFGLWCGIQVI